FLDSVVNVRSVKLVLAIVGHEVEQGFLHEGLVVRIAQRAAHQHRGAIADVAGDDLSRKLGALVVAQHSVDGVGQIQAGIHQRAVQVKDQQLDVVDRYRAVAPDHYFQYIPAPREDLEWKVLAVAPTNPSGANEGEPWPSRRLSRKRMPLRW